MIFSIQTRNTHPWDPTEVCAWQPSSSTVVTPTASFMPGASSTTVLTTTMAPTHLVNAYGVSIRWQSTDTITPTAKTIIVTATSASTSGSASGLTSGAKAGIGVGVALGAVLITALATWFFFLRRKRGQGDAVKTGNQKIVELFGGSRQEKAELPGGPHQEKAELPGGRHQQQAELSGGRDKQRAELPGGRDQEAAELPADGASIFSKLSEEAKLDAKS